MVPKGLSPSASSVWPQTPRNWTGDGSTRGQEYRCILPYSPGALPRSAKVPTSADVAPMYHERSVCAHDNGGYTRPGASTMTMAVSWIPVIPPCPWRIHGSRLTGMRHVSRLISDLPSPMHSLGSAPTTPYRAPCNDTQRCGSCLLESRASTPKQTRCNVLLRR